MNRNITFCYGTHDFLTIIIYLRIEKNRERDKFITIFSFDDILLVCYKHYNKKISFDKINANILNRQRKPRDTHLA